MLVELAVRDLGVISELQLVFHSGMTVLTGETGAGKTLLIDAIELLVGGRSDPALVRSGAEEAWVEGRFILDGEDVGGDEVEVVLARAVPRVGRSRAYINGNFASVAQLREWGERLIDLHGQHAHQSLLSTAAQRQVLDRFAQIDLTPLNDARQKVASIEREMEALGGDPHARAREIDLLRYQIEELEAANLVDEDEESRLEAEEDDLNNVVAHQQIVELVAQALASDGGALEQVGEAISAVAGESRFKEVEARLRGSAGELADLVQEIRNLGEALEPNPQRLEELRLRRALLRDLQRKYGDSLAKVMAFHHESQTRLDELLSHDQAIATLSQSYAEAKATLAKVEASVGERRRLGAAPLALSIESHLSELAMPKAQVFVAVGAEDPGDAIEFQIAANPGLALAPLTKVASGGELARIMLAIRLVLSSGPPVLIFDEVDAGIGGEAAVAVGRALAALAPQRQVMVVTHLAQVAAYADWQVKVAKSEDGNTTVSQAVMLEANERAAELARMLSGDGASQVALAHAEELLERAGDSRR